MRRFSDDRTLWFLSVPADSVCDVKGKAKRDKQNAKAGFQPGTTWREISKKGPHDRFMRQMFGDVATVVSLLRWMFPPEVAACIDWDSVRVKSGAQITDALDARYADLVLEFSFLDDIGGVGLVLLEHQRQVDPTMVLRTVEYNVGMFREWKSEHPEAGDYPLVFNLVLFTGRDGRAWTASTDLVNVARLPPVLRPTTTPIVGPGRYTLIDIAHTDPADILELPINDRAKVALTLVRRASAEADLAERARMLMPHLRRMLEAPNGDSGLGATVNYIVSIWETPLSVLEEMFAPLGPAAKEVVMTTAEQLRAEGRVEGQAEGRVEGKAETLLELLKQKFGSLSPDIVMTVNCTTDLEKLNIWTLRVLEATNVTDVIRP